MFERIARSLMKMNVWRTQIPKYKYSGAYAHVPLILTRRNVRRWMQFGQMTGVVNNSFDSALQKKMQALFENQT